MRSKVLAASVCAVLVVSSAPTVALAQMGAGEDPRNSPRYEPRPHPYTAEQVPTLAAGLIANQVFAAGTRGEALRAYQDRKAELEASLAAGHSYVEMYPPEDGKLAVPDRTYAPGTKDTEATPTLSSEEVAYFLNAQVWKEHLRLKGSVSTRPVVEEPASLRRTTLTTCTIQFTPEQIPALAAGLNTDEILYHSGSRAAALQAWERAQADLRKLVTNGQGQVADFDGEGLKAYEGEYSASSVVQQDAERSSKGLTVVADSPFSAREAAYFMNSAVFAGKMANDCGRELYRTPPVTPSSLKLALAPDAIVGIVLAIAALLGAGAAAYAGLIPGVSGLTL